MKKYKLLALAPLFAIYSCGGSSEVTTSNSDSTQTETVKETKQTVEFESLDSLLIAADLYEIDASKPCIVLCHQARFCKFEYAGVAERFNKLGFNCLAIDQRSGGPICNQRNETWLRAIAQNKPVDYLDAEQDIVAAIDYAYQKYNQPVIILGSSYSSTLCVYQGLENDKVSAVISFSPGNYFAEQRGDLIPQLINFEKPFFFTAAKNEIPFVREIVLGRKRTDNQIVFSPVGEGAHGARVLWETQQDGEEYWVALEDFLKKL